MIMKFSRRSNIYDDSESDRQSSRPLTMSSRTSRRVGAPASLPLTPQPKPTISVEEWEAKAPLSDLHLRSINAIKLASEKVPLPLKVRQTYIPYLKYEGVFLFE